MESGWGSGWKGGMGYWIEKVDQRWLKKVDQYNVAPHCPNLDFGWRADECDRMNFSMDLLAVDWIESETYGVTVKVQGAESIDWKYLSSLKLTGIDGPQSCVEVTKSNKDCSINSATEFTVSFPVYAQKIENEPCQVLMPSFQIEYEFLKGEAQQYSEGWKWGETCFNLESGCQHQSSSSKANCDFPFSTSTASGSSTTWTPSTSETPCTETPSGSSTSSSWASLSSETPCTETPSGSGSWASSSTETPCTETPGSSSSWTSSNTETPCTETPGSSSSWASSSSETPCTECEQGSTSSTYWASSSSTYWESSSSTYWVSWNNHYAQNVLRPPVLLLARSEVPSWNPVLYSPALNVSM
ncbi:ANM_HP_G0096120.mRNA.1.CDS.1 [Saccharomyces cerevisiae]|nr:ANM_HP_G0096120.mRNA.1.CDS.1 [Saccharomyces cerevisiae]CAI6382608.1 ANM_HP_G0096120.mRNA.1.CDS.1 [Saccharomyces cerevisiae]